MEQLKESEIMSKIKLIDTDKCKLLAVMVPEYGWDFRVDYGNRVVLSFACINEPDAIKLPEGNWQILGLSTELTEEQWSEIVKYVGLPWCAYKDYRSNSNWFSTAKESGLSLLEANQITEPTLILKQL